MSVSANQLIGNWKIEGVQSGWSSPPHGPSGAWKGTLVLRANMSSKMVFTSGNVAPSRDGDWSLNGNTLSVIDSMGSVWTANISNPSNPSSMNGSYISGVPGAAGGSWGATKV
jgi:hypothetical protein